MYLYLFNITLLVSCTFPCLMYLYSFHIIVLVSFNCTCLLNVLVLVKWTCTRKMYMYSFNVLVLIWCTFTRLMYLRNKFVYLGCKQLSPLLVRGVMAEFESFHWSMDSRTNTTSDDAWLCQLSALQSHSISCFTPTY